MRADSRFPARIPRGSSQTTVKWKSQKRFPPSSPLSLSLSLSLLLVAQHSAKRATSFNFASSVARPLGWKHGNRWKRFARTYFSRVFPHAGYSAAEHNPRHVRRAEEVAKCRGEHTSEIDSHPVSPGPNFSAAAATRRVLARSLRAAIDGLDLTRDASDSARVDWWYLSELRLIYKPCLICDAIYKESSHPSRSRPPLVRLLPVPDLPCSFAAVCASPYDRSAVRPTRFSSHPPRMDIHSTPHTVFSAFLSPSLSSLSNTRTRAHTRALLFPRCVSPPFDPVSLRRSLYALAIRIFQSAVHA